MFRRFHRYHRLSLLALRKKCLLAEPAKNCGGVYDVYAGKVFFPGLLSRLFSEDLPREIKSTTELGLA